jgi:hypothetical protein
MPQLALTANLLKNGDVVYRTGAGTWSLSLADAIIYTDKAQAEAALAAAITEQNTNNEVVGPYIFPLAEDSPHAPTSTRERIRAIGPTIRADLGKQADGQAAANPNT